MRPLLANSAGINRSAHRRVSPEAERRIDQPSVVDKHLQIAQEALEIEEPIVMQSFASVADLNWQCCLARGWCG